MRLLSFLVGCFFLMKHAHSLSTTREISPQWLSTVLSFDDKPQQEESIPNSNIRRRLQSTATTGDVWKACSGNRTEGKMVVDQNSTEYSQSIYQHTEYDDNHQPACTCFYDTGNQEYWAQCALGDSTCDASGTCTGTHEFFLFSDTSGDLKQKSSCQLCKDRSNNNCAGVVETCTLVAFGSDGTPTQCVQKEILSDGSQTLCDDCKICQYKGKFGIYHQCFGNPTPTGKCDHSGTAHLHNFEPIHDPTKPKIGGTFGDLCLKVKSPELVDFLYKDTNYADEYSKRCDCQDPTSGIINCDLYVEKAGCFANECTEATETFFFDENSGEMMEKMTCATLSGSLIYYCSLVTFRSHSFSSSSSDPIIGQPTKCSIFSPENLDTCDDCTICQDQVTGAYGIQFDCFGQNTIGPNTCWTLEGRAVYNLESVYATQQGSTQGASSQQTASPPTLDDDGFATAPSRANDDDEGYLLSKTKKPIQPSFANRNSNNNSSSQTQQMVLGIVFGGIALVAFLATMVTLTSKRRPPMMEEEPAATTTMTEIATELDDPPSVLVNQDGQPMVQDPTPIKIT